MKIDKRMKWNLIVVGWTVLLLVLVAVWIYSIPVPHSNGDPYPEMTVTKWGYSEEMGDTPAQEERLALDEERTRSEAPRFADALDQALEERMKKFRLDTKMAEWKWLLHLWQEDGHEGSPVVVEWQGEVFAVSARPAWSG